MNEATRKELERIHHDDTSFKRRIRAQAILLNARGYRLDALADIFVVDRDTVSQWITNWEKHAFDGLSDIPRPRRPRKTNAKEDAMLLHEVEQHPQYISVAIGELKKKIIVSKQTVRRRLCEAGYRYKRVVKRPLNTPDAEAYERCKKHMAKLERREERGE